MNLGQWILLWMALAGLILISALIGGIIAPTPSVGTLPVLGFTGNASNIYAATCVVSSVVTPQANRNNQSNLYFAGSSSVDPRGMSQMVWAWAQLIQHDIFLYSTLNTSTFDIQLGSSYGNMSLPYLNLTANCTSPNGRTWALDGSPIYSDAINPSRLSLLRTGTFGNMRQSAGGYLPFMPDGSGSFLAGDVDVNENPLLASLVTLFVREHNYWARELRQIQPLWTDDQLFWKARQYVIIELQRITTQEWLPILLGGYLGTPPHPPVIPIVFPANSTVVTAEFAALGSEFYRSLANDNSTNVTNVTSTVLTSGLEGIFNNAWSQSSLSFDVKVAPAQCNGTQSFDYITAGLTRAQELGITTNYSHLCATFGTTPKNVATAGSRAVLAQVWNEAPPAWPGGSLQWTTINILLEQLNRVQANDPNWFTNPSVVASAGSTFYPILASTTLADVIYRNTQLGPCKGCNLDSSVFWKK